MFESGPIGSAACVHVEVLIRVAGEQGVRGWRHLTKRVAEPIGFLHARIRCPGPVCLWGRPSYLGAQEGNRMAKDILARNPATVLDPDFALHENIAARARALREGQELPELDELFEPIRGCEEFSSAADALPMTEADIRNVRRLIRDDAKQLLAAIKAFAPTAVARAMQEVDELWGGWPEDDERWTLTPHELRRVKEKSKCRLLDVAGPAAAR
jgi:hypothetical protein